MVANQLGKDTMCYRLISLFDIYRLVLEHETLKCITMESITLVVVNKSDTTIMRYRPINHLHIIMLVDKPIKILYK